MAQKLLAVELSVEEIEAIAECALVANHMLVRLGPERASAQLTQRVELVTRVLARVEPQINELVRHLDNARE